MPGLPMVPSHSTGSIRTERNAYTFASSPRTLLTRKARYRSEEIPDQHSQSYGNIMHDKRVIRGSTVVSHPMYSITDSRGVETGGARLAEARRRNMARRKAQTTASRALRMRMSTPPPVEGRKHEDIQTDSYLEQLFDFEVEVKPVLEVLVGKTMEQAIIELLQEEREAEQKERQRRLNEIKEAERAEQKRLEEEEAETKRRLEQVPSPDSKPSSEHGESHKEDASTVLTTKYIQELLPSILDGLKSSGYLTEEIKEDVEENFMSWLMSEVTQEMKRVVENRDLLSDIVKEILDTRAELHRAMGKKETKKRKPKSFKTLSVEGTDNEEYLSDVADDDADENEQPTKNPLPDLYPRLTQVRSILISTTHQIEEQAGGSSQPLCETNGVIDAAAQRTKHRIRSAPRLGSLVSPDPVVPGAQSSKGSRVA
ncbi:hypothetical protein LSTR_LSTR003087 [Laodelphax striatellus]|uniref:Radial spoke head protein 3 homolog n=1 Tax=Laodelphax striatellus TaxID=195883 RepID=A0A482WWF8_LAOST|nr:hypothetical protein LSTR_LSTR003087 [Laodelphax striatellus]